MPYNAPTPHEMRLKNSLEKIARKVDKMILKETGGSADFILVVNSAAVRKQQKETGKPPVGMHVSNLSRPSAALALYEMLTKWQINGDIPALSELTDDNGNTLTDLIEQATEEELTTVQQDGGLH